MHERAPGLVPAVARHEVGAWPLVLRLPAVASPAHLLIVAEHVCAVGEGLHDVEVALGLLQLLLEAHCESVARGCCVICVLKFSSE